MAKICAKCGKEIGWFGYLFTAYWLPDDKFLCKECHRTSQQKKTSETDKQEEDVKELIDIEGDDRESYRSAPLTPPDTKKGSIVMGKIFTVWGIIVYSVGGLLGMLVCMAIVIDNLGFIGGVIAFVFFPIALVFAPVYALIADGNWFPALLIYGCSIGGTLLKAIGSSIDKG